MKKYIDTNYVDLTLLQTRSTSRELTMPNSATILYYRMIRSLLPRINSSHIKCDHDNENYNTLRLRQIKLTMNNDTHKGPIFSIYGLQ